MVTYICETGIKNMWIILVLPLNYYKFKGGIFMKAECEEIKPGKYRHFKGMEYEVLFIAKNSETLEPMVVYRALYGEGEIWVRPAFMWNETVLRDGISRPRFEYIGE